MTVRKYIPGAAAISLLTALVTLSLTGCGGGGGSSSAAQNNIVAATGGTVTNGSASLTVPANSLTADTLVSIASTTGPADPLGRVVIRNSVFEIKPSGTTFTAGNEATLTLHYGALPTGISASSLTICTATDGFWQALSGSTVDTSAKTVSIKLQHLSTYGILGDQPSGN